MENIINIFHYCIYLLDRKLHLLSNKINPFLLLYKIPYLKRKAKENGEDLNKVYNETFINKDYGFNIMVAGGITVGVIFLFLVAFFQTALFIFNIENRLKPTGFIILGIISFFICYFLIFKNDKYLIYGKKYEKWTKYNRRINIWLSILFLVMTVIFFFVSTLYFIN